MPIRKKKSTKRSKTSSKTSAKRKTRTKRKGSGGRSGEEDITAASKAKKAKKAKKSKKVSKRSRKKGRGFKHYEVQWDKSGGSGFVVKTKDRRFFGEVQKRPDRYIVDILTTVKDEPVKVETIEYTDTDKLNESSLASDINAAIEKYLHDAPYESDRCHICGDPGHRSINAGNLCVQYLKKKLERPVMKIRRIDTLDSLIQRLKDFRETCVRAGGNRGFVLAGDNEDTPRVWLEVDFTAQAKMLEGKSIPAGQTSRIDQQATAMIKENKGSKTKLGGQKPKDSKETESAAETSPAPLTSQGSIETLLEMLENTTDKVERRKLRAKLRKLGHRGGLRSRKDKT